MNKKRLLTYLLYSYTILFSAFVFAGNITVKGKVTSQGKAISSVQITDGKTIVLTDKHGNFRLETSDNSEYVYYT